MKNIKIMLLGIAICLTAVWAQMGSVIWMTVISFTFMPIGIIVCFVGFFYKDNKSKKENDNAPNNYTQQGNINTNYYTNNLPYNAQNNVTENNTKPLIDRADNN
jgi:1,4-dihydroxy-2-naphthoate octaprenyltransferase